MKSREETRICLITLCNVPRERLPYNGQWDLSNLDLRGRVFREFDLSAANLTGINLSGADLHAANLSDANLCDASLNGANLRQTCLFRTTLRNADLSSAKGLTTRQLREGFDLIEAILDPGRYADVMAALRGVRG